jgi:hypothetical protein
MEGEVTSKACNIQSREVRYLISGLRQVVALSAMHSGLICSRLDSSTFLDELFVLPVRREREKEGEEGPHGVFLTE